jgi:hypothetical protein
MDPIDERVSDRDTGASFLTCAGRAISTAAKFRLSLKSSCLPQLNEHFAGSYEIATFPNALFRWHR